MHALCICPTRFALHFPPALTFTAAIRRSRSPRHGPRPRPRSTRIIMPLPAPRRIHARARAGSHLKPHPLVSHLVSPSVRRSSYIYTTRRPRRCRCLPLVPRPTDRSRAGLGPMLIRSRYRLHSVSKCQNVSVFHFPSHLLSSAFLCLRVHSIPLLAMVVVGCLVSGAPGVRASEHEARDGGG